jgi:hypothetical protein
LTVNLDNGTSSKPFPVKGPKGDKGDKGLGISSLDFNDNGLVVTYDGGQSPQQVEFWEKLSNSSQMNNLVGEKTIKCDANSGCSTDKRLTVSNNGLIVNGSFEANAPSGTQTITGGSIKLNTENLTINDTILNINKLVQDYGQPNNVVGVGTYSLG